ncbi:CASP-like protein 4A1 [Durio zibethinus]|uniref:CASP-like protein n=1 Tax=Durio zibethinus TaxID=66656 RepID=A0A6P6BBE7_DURZI|nr:CASP-like protein 4A1 [Durio zibethinus]
MENEKQQQQTEDKQQNHQEEDKQQQQDQQNHQEEKQQQEEQQEQEKHDEEAENKHNHTASRFPLSKRSTPPKTIPKAQLPPSDHSPVDSPLSSDHSSLSHGFSPPPLASQPSDPNSLEEEAENKHNHTVSRFPLSKRSTPPKTIPKAQSPPSDHSPVDSPLSSDHFSLSHGFSPPPLASQPSDPNSKPPALAVSKAEFNQSTATTVEVEEQSQKLGSGSGKRLRPDLSILRRTKRDKMVKKASLWSRISGFVFCLVSFSVLAADRDQGWALDSFYRYKEFRFCMAVNVIGFVYSGIQAYDLAYQLTFGKQKPRSRLRCYLDFVLDQMLAYLLISASSSAAVRVDDWQSNWGKDKFLEMARASMALSLVAFIALALSSLISGYTLCTFKSM